MFFINGLQCFLIRAGNKVKQTKFRRSNIGYKQNINKPIPSIYAVDCLEFTTA